MGKSEGKRPLGRPRRRWQDGIRMDLSEMGWRGMDWIQLTYDRGRWRAFINTVMKMRVLAPRSYLVNYFNVYTEQHINKQTGNAIQCSVNFYKAI
jgi:hypothetical protein